MKAAVLMEKFEADGLWKPTASKTSGHVYLAKMFFMYKVEAK